MSRYLRAALALLLLAGPAFAQTPQRQVQIIVPFAPGASADGIGRIMATELAPRLNRSVVVENRPGAGGSLGLQVLAKAAPDGDTLGVGATGALVINPHIPGAAAGSFDPLRDLAPVAKLIEIPLVVVANKEKGPKSIAELIERAKTMPGGLSYGSTGTHSGQHLAMELLKKATGANFVHVPYRGSAPAVTDLLGGQILVACVDLTAAHEQIKAGNVIALGVTSAQRSSIAPDIPTIAEGGVPGFQRAAGFIGLFAPAGTPAALVQRLSREAGAIMATPDADARVRLLSAQVSYADETAFAKLLVDESARWKEAVRTLDLSH
jgi:tripartite-type tricarboxylate transporter receptor subunit TctC